MYSRNMKRGGDGLSDEEREIAKYGLPPKYDGSVFRRPLPPDGTEDGREEDRAPHEEPIGRPAPPRRPHGGPPAEHLNGDGSPRPNGEGGKIDGLIESLGERLGAEEMLILALILILAGSGGGECEDAGDAILLLALLLILG